MIFVPLPSPPYTDRRLSSQGSKEYSSLSTPKMFNYRIMIPYFMGLSRRIPQTPLYFRGFTILQLPFPSKQKAPPKRSLFPGPS